MENYITYRTVNYVSKTAKDLPEMCWLRWTLLAFHSFERTQWNEVKAWVDNFLGIISVFCQSDSRVGAFITWMKKSRLLRKELDHIYLNQTQWPVVAVDTRHWYCRNAHSRGITILVSVDVIFLSSASVQRNVVDMLKLRRLPWPIVVIGVISVFLNARDILRVLFIEKWIWIKLQCSFI